MAISGLTPTTALPGLVPGANLAAAQQLPGIPLTAASAGASERPGIGTRLLNAMRSAISELRGGSPTGLGVQSLPMQAVPHAQAPVSLAKPGAAAKPKFPNAKTWKDAAGNVRELGTGRVVKPAAGAVARPATGAAQPVGSQLPANAVQVPGATVYSYDQQGNPVAPTMQQLGMTPTMLQGLEGVAGAADPSGPQLNATNQTNVGLGSGLGSATPVLGQPIVTAAPGTPAGTTRTGGTQSVANENVFDSDSHNQGLGWGSGWGAPFGGVATPAAPYGSSMLGGSGTGWF